MSARTASDSMAFFQPWSGKQRVIWHTIYTPMASGSYSVRHHTTRLENMQLCKIPPTGHHVRIGACGVSGMFDADVPTFANTTGAAESSDTTQVMNLRYRMLTRKDPIRLRHELCLI